MEPRKTRKRETYLKATGMKLGLLVNFASHPKATIVRLAL